MLTELVEFDIELFARHSTWVLEAAVFVVRKLMHIREDGTQRALSAVGLGMRLTVKPIEEIGISEIVRIFNQMVNNALIWLAVFADKGWTRLVTTCVSHQSMCRFTSVMAHAWIILSAFAVVTMFPSSSIRRTIYRHLFCARGT